ncbi:hypothetical protein CKA32_002564 [Geitlerinema sp. FC II]|nr:hypothetical protein CKA32_002564 [Geitlerinema sp. FC II]
MASDMNRSSIVGWVWGKGGLRRAWGQIILRHPVSLNN